MRFVPLSEFDEKPKTFTFVPLEPIQSEPILSPEDVVMGSFGAPNTEPPSKKVAPVKKPLAQSLTAEQYKAAVEKRKQETPARSISDAALDTGITLLKGAIGLPEAFVGLADIPALGRVGKFLEDSGYKPREAKEILDTYLSEGQQAANRKLREAQGFFPTIQAALENPSTIATAVGESAPQMVGGAGLARGLLKAAPAVAPFVAGAVGEGLLGAGSAAEQIRGSTTDKLLTPKQAVSAAGSGAGTALFGAVGGRLAQKLGFTDIDTLLASGPTGGASKSVADFTKKVLGSGISEGVFEEMPQSAQETMWMNYATDKPLFEGVPEAAGMGAVTGFTMGVAGGGANAALQRPPGPVAAPLQEPAVAPAPPSGEPSFTFEPLTPEPGGRIEPTFEEAPAVVPPPPIAPPKVEAVPGMMTDEDLAQPENVSVTPVTVTEPEVPAAPPPVTPVTPIEPTVAAATLPETPTVPPAKAPKLFEPSPNEHQAQDMTVVAVPVKDLTLSKDVPQFKAGASDKGVVEPLSGKFTQEGVAPIAVWRRLDGTMEVISGRHRLDLAQRTGTELINAQVYDEAAGFDKTKAAILDAELNIRDEQGKVKDYVNYFKASGTDRETADAKGFLARTKGKRGFTIADQGSDALVAAINSDQIGDEAAYYVAINAPKDERLQNVGLRAIMDGKSMNTAVNTMQAVKAMAVEQDTTTDMFGFDDSLIKEAQEMAKIASKMQQSIQTRLAAITGAAKNPAMAKAEGIDVRDPDAIKRRIEELRAQKAALENWSTSPEIVAEIRAARGVEAPQLELRGETEAEIRAREATQDADRQAQEAKDIADRERDFFQLQPQVAEREEAPTMDMFAGEAAPSAEYQAASELANRASAQFRKVQEAYRSQEIGDDDFLAGRKVYDTAMAEFDKAVKKEQGLAEPTEEKPTKKKEAAAKEGRTNFFKDALPNLGFKRLERGDSMAYRDKAGKEFATYERDGVRVAFSSNLVLFEDDRGRVNAAMSEPTDIVFQFLGVAPSDRKKGKATAALLDVVRAADMAGAKLYIEPTSLDRGGPKTPQLVNFYKRSGFTQATPGSDKILVREPGQKAPLSKEMQRVKELMLAEEDMYFTDDAQELQGALKDKNWVAYAGRPVYTTRGRGVMARSELTDVQDLERINTQEELDAALEQGKQIGFLEADKAPAQAADDEASMIVGDATTPEQREDAEALAKDVGGTVVWQQGQYALIRGYSILTGDPVYIPTFGTSRARLDIESFTGTQINPDLKREMIDAKKQAEQDAAEKHKRNPFVKFADGVAVSESISSEIEGVIREWKKLLKLDVPMYIGTIEDARRNKDNYTGPHRRIGSGTLDKGEAGSTRRMADGSHYILFSKSTSPTYMLETLAHELGHVHQKIVYENASPEDKKALQDAHKKWVERQKGKTAKELIDSLRGRATQRRPKPSAALKSEDLTSYWRSFSEWYADQTSRWAMSDKVPVTAVEKFFKRLGNQLRRFYQQLKARKYLPDDTFAQYINRVTERPPALVPDQSDIANQMSIETEPKKDSSAAPSKGEDGVANDDKKILEKYSRPNTPQLDPAPLKTQIVNVGKLSKDFFTYAVSDPLEALGTAANSVDRAILYARNKNVWFGSGLNAADFSKYNGDLVTSQNLATASVALDNAIRGGQIAAEVIFQGGIKFDQKSRNFVAVKRDKGMAGVYEAEIALKKRLGDQLGTDIIQGYLEAKRSRSIQNEYFDREAEYEFFKSNLEELQATNAPEEDIMAARDAMAEAKEDLKAIELVYKKIRMSDEEIDEFIAREKAHPELRKIMNNWSAINKNMLEFWRQVGLLSDKRYESLSKIKDYVPWQRIMNDETDIHSPVQASNRKMTNIGLEKLFKKGKPTVITDVVAKDGQQDFKIQPAAEVEVEINGSPVDPDKFTMTADGQVKLDVPVTAGDLVVFKASREIENIIDNMTRNVMRMTMNGLRQAAAQRIVMEYATRDKKGKIMMFPKADKERGRFDFIVNGQRVVVEIQDPLIAESIFGMESLDIAMLAPLAAVANFTRRTITLSGVFQIKQVFKDAPTAALVTGVKHPLLLIGGVYKGFVTSLLNTDPTVKILKAAGIGGFQSLARTPEAEIKRRLGIMNRNVFDFVIKGLDHIGDASDMAQRVAVYKRVLAETGNETQALYQAANVINFLHHGSGQVAQAVVKTVPFAGAYANSMDVLIQALAGGGLKGRSRANALARLAMTGTLLAGITLLYCMLVGDDEEYNQMDDQTKMRNFMIPGTKVILPMNTSAAYFYKAVPEMLYNKIMKEGTKNAVDERRLRTALKEAAIDMLLGPTPVPSAVKPFIEIGLNKDFFTGRPVVPESLAKLEAAERYVANTSEAGKFLSSLTGTEEKRLLDPLEADHLIRGIFGTAGAMTQWFTNSIAVASGERAAMTEKQQPITGSFLRTDIGRLNEDLFYDFKAEVDKRYGTYAKMLEREDDKAADAYEEKHSDIIDFYQDVNKMDSELKEINAEIRYYGESKDTGLTPQQRREEIKLLQIEKQEMLDDIIEMRKEAGL